MTAVVTSRISWSPTAGFSPTRLTMMSVGVSNSRGLTPAGRKSAALAGSMLTPVMSTPAENVNAKPVKMSAQGNADAAKRQRRLVGDRDRRVADVDRRLVVHAHGKMGGDQHRSATFNFRGRRICIGRAGNGSCRGKTTRRPCWSRCRSGPPAPAGRLASAPSPRRQTEQMPLGASVVPSLLKRVTAVLMTVCTACRPRARRSRGRSLREPLQTG